VFCLPTCFPHELLPRTNSPELSAPQQSGERKMRLKVLAPLPLRGNSLCCNYPWLGCLVHSPPRCSQLVVSALGPSSPRPAHIARRWIASGKHHPTLLSLSTFRAASPPLRPIHLYNNQRTREVSLEGQSKDEDWTSSSEQYMPYAPPPRRCGRLPQVTTSSSCCWRDNVQNNCSDAPTCALLVWSDASQKIRAYTI